jgi:hypothetical protein
MSTEASPGLFSKQENAALLRRLSQDLRALSTDTFAPEGLAYQLGQILELMVSNPEKFDEYTTANSEWIGQTFLGEIERYFGLPPVERGRTVRSIFTSAYRFLCELEFTQPGDPSFEIRRIINFVNDNLDGFNDSDRQQLVFAAYTMPAQVVKRLIGHPSVVEFKRFSEVVEQARELKDKWDNDIKKREKLLEGLSANLNKVTSDYNFAGLVHGFKTLKNHKESERIFSFWSLIALGCVMSALPLIQLGFVILNLQTIELHRATLIYSLPTILALEVILLYFFRVVLGQFRSVKAQLLQIDLRISICQFVESYAEYMAGLRAKDSSALTKFEAMIFSGLVIEESGIPSTFDGADQLASLIRSLRGGGQ